MSKFDLPSTSGPVVKEKRWVEVPDKDMFDVSFPTIRINELEFPAGRHYVDADIADTIERLVKGKTKGDIRIMSPKQDISSENAMNRFGVGSRMGQSAKPETIA